MAKPIDQNYDQWFQDHPKTGMDLVRGLDEKLKMSDCSFGDKPIPCFFKPLFLHQSHTHTLKSLIHHIADMLERLAKAYFEYPDLRPFFRIPKEYESWIRIDPGYKRCVLIARPDAFLTSHGFRFVEFNCDSPAGPGYADTEERILRNSPVMRKIRYSYRFFPERRMKSLLHALLSCYREYGGNRSHPQIAIVDWRNVRTRNEFVIIQKYFKSQGYPCQLADPRDLRFRKGRLYAGDFRIDLIYRRVIFNELWEHRRQVVDLLKAYRLGRVCIVNPLRSRLVANKIMLGFMTDPKYDFLFTPDQIKVRDHHIPWTRQISHPYRKRQAEAKRFRKHILHHQKQLVMKPADRYGGHGVTIGKGVSIKTWGETLRRAVSGRENWVVQRYVPISQMTVPVIHRRQLKLVKKRMNINPFIFNGRYSGAMARLSRQAVINVSAGGGLIPVMSYGPAKKKGRS